MKQIIVFRCEVDYGEKELLLLPLSLCYGKMSNSNPAMSSVVTMGLIVAEILLKTAEDYVLA